MIKNKNDNRGDIDDKLKKIKNFSMIYLNMMFLYKAFALKYIN